MQGVIDHEVVSDDRKYNLKELLKVAQTMMKRVQKESETQTEAWLMGGGGDDSSSQASRGGRRAATPEAEEQ